MASDTKTKTGLNTHSNLARSWAAGNRDPIGHAERTMQHVDIASTLAAMHWAGVEEHLAERGIY